MSSAVQDLLNVLDLEPLEVNLFRGRSPQVGWQRVFGGQVIGQALVAAVRTFEVRPPHSLHAYFLLPGDPKVPIIYDVDRMRDGKSFTTRRVTARQHGHPIFQCWCRSTPTNRPRPSGQNAGRTAAGKPSERRRYA
jgi:acyl-CoA thioesterase-2